MPQIIVKVDDEFKKKLISMLKRKYPRAANTSQAIRWLIDDVYEGLSTEESTPGAREVVEEIKKEVG